MARRLARNPLTRRLAVDLQRLAPVIRVEPGPARAQVVRPQAAELRRLEQAARARLIRVEPDRALARPDQLARVRLVAVRLIPLAVLQEQAERQAVQQPAQALEQVALVQVVLPVRAALVQVVLPVRAALLVEAELPVQAALPVVLPVEAEPLVEAEPPVVEALRVVVQVVTAAQRLRLLPIRSLS